jgi:hypothetical protein
VFWLISTELQAFKNLSNNNKCMATGDTLTQAHTNSLSYFCHFWKLAAMLISNQTSSNLINLLILMCSFLWSGSFWAHVNWISFTISDPVLYSFIKWLIAPVVLHDRDHTKVAMLHVEGWMKCLTWKQPREEDWVTRVWKSTNIRC